MKRTVASEDDGSCTLKQTKLCSIEKGKSAFSDDQQGILSDDLVAEISGLTDSQFDDRLEIEDRCDLKLKFVRLVSRSLSKRMMNYFEESLQYYSGDLTKVQVFGKWHDIPRKQVAFGAPGLSYKFSNTTVPAMEWDPVVKSLATLVGQLCGCDFNFALVNRYKDGQDYMGEHKDDEADLDPEAPIASLSLGQSRDFLLRHQDVRRRRAATAAALDAAALKAKSNIKIELCDGDLLVMLPPTNTFWYHSLPKRAKALGVRLNFTFRKILVKL